MKVEFLQSLGLTRSEISVYLAMLTEGNAEAKTIHKKSTVPFGKIYDILYSLNRKGMVDIQYSRPKLFRAIEPGNAIKNLLDSRNDELNKLEQMAPDAENELKKLHKKPDTQSPFWTVIINNQPSVDFFNRVFKEVKNEASLYINRVPSITSQTQDNQPPHHSMKALMPSLSNLFEQGIELKVLIRSASPEMIGVHKHFLGELVKFKNFDVRFTNVITNPFLIIDNRKVIFNIWDPLSDEEIFLASIYLWNQDLANRMKKQFDEIWQKSEKFDL